MPITDTLENARRFEAAGFTHEQAQTLSEALEKTSRQAQPDLSRLVTYEQLRQEMGGVRQEMEAMEGRLRGYVQEQLRSQMLWFFAMLVGLTGVAVALIKLLPTP